MALLLFVIAAALLLIIWACAATAGKGLAYRLRGSPARSRAGAPRPGADLSSARQAANMDEGRAPRPRQATGITDLEASSDELVDMALLCLNELRRERGRDSRGAGARPRAVGRLRRSEGAWDPFAH
jgi:hypothetical protein